MRRGTTPTNIFHTDIDLRDADVVYITYAQQGRPVIEKTGEDSTITENSVTVMLSQAETLKLRNAEVEIQIRARFPSGRAVASDIIKTTAERVLKEGVI